jgi:hypothetical protein
VGFRHGGNNIVSKIKKELISLEVSSFSLKL